jgi:hypothetical protein
MNLPVRSTDSGKNAISGLNLYLLYISQHLKVDIFHSAAFFSAKDRVAIYPRREKRKLHSNFCSFPNNSKSNAKDY